MLSFDHIAISARTLDEGMAWVEECLGVTLTGGGKHPQMATHNRLLGLGDLYLEVIAADPGAMPPGRPRWFDLDRFEGPPRLTNWVARSDDLEADLALAPSGSGRPMALARGDYRWRMAVPDDGVLPFDNAFPALIQWQNDLHPTQALPDSGLRLHRLTIAHPQSDALRAAIRLTDPRIAVVRGATRHLSASFHTPKGDRSLP